ncbi:MAG: hypothetical protein ACLR0U_05085 [Enterocloster clostridioformis]
MVTIMYSSGLRIGEVCRLRYKDVDRKNMRLLYFPWQKSFCPLCNSLKSGA